MKLFSGHSVTHGVIMLMCRYDFAFEFKRRARKREGVGMKLRVVKMLMILDPPAGVGQLQ